MMTDVLDVLRCLRVACKAAGGQQAWAERNGISPQYVSDVLNARRDPGGSILAALGFRRLVRYECVAAPRKISVNRRSGAAP